MNKKIKSLLASIFAASLLTACSTNKNQNIVNTSSSSKSASAQASSETSEQSAPSSGLSLDDLQITEYKCENEYATTYLLAIKNNSDQTIDIYANATAYDANNNMVGAANGEIDVLGSGEESAMYLYFDGAHNVDHINYKNNLQYSTTPYYQPVIHNLSAQDSVSGDNFTIAVTNNGDTAAEFVEVYAVFLNADNTPLEIDEAYIVDSNDEIAPGATQSANISYYSSYDKGPFDHVTYYLAGRSDQ